MSQVKINEKKVRRDEEAVRAAMREIRSVHCPGLGSQSDAKPAFLREGDASPFDVYLAVVVESGDCYVMDSRNHPEGFDPVKESDGGQVRLWPIEPSVTRGELKAALADLEPKVNWFRDGVTICRDAADNRLVEIRLTEKAAALEARIGVIGRRD